jgi:hypothetical protein
MKSLTTLRDELAEKYDDVFLHSDHLNPSDLNLAFHAGWDALLSHLEGAAGEFDEQAFRARWGGISPSDYQFALMIAKEQFEQSRARIGLIRAQNETLSILNMELQAKLAKCEALKRNTLFASLEGLKRWQDNLATTKSENARLRVALHEIADHKADTWAGEVAREALKDTTK